MNDDISEQVETAIACLRHECGVDVEPLVMRGRLAIAYDFTEIVAQQLHYFESVDKVDLNTCKAADFVIMAKGSRQRYMSDPIFKAKVSQVVARLMQALGV